MPAPEIEILNLRAMDKVGKEGKFFLQGMLNRLAIGSLRYGRGHKESKDDHAATAILRIQTAMNEGDRNQLIDAANFCLLEWRRMPEGPEDSGEHSPGVVQLDGSIRGARGRYA